MTAANHKVSRLHSVAMILLILTLVGFWIYINLGDPAGFYTVRYDPEYAYFLNSLSIIKGKPYVYIEHPGTPLELVGSGILFLTYPFVEASGTSFMMYHLTHPEIFLGLTRGLLTILSIATLYLIARYAILIRNWMDAFFSIAIAASFYAIHAPFTFDTLVYWSHNSFAFPLGTLVLLLMFIRLRSERQVLWWELILLGAATGFLTAIQLWFAAWVVGVGTTIFAFNLLQGRGVVRAILSLSILGVGAVTGFVISTLPILHEYLRFFGWVIRLLTHQGRYGFGEQGFTSLPLLSNNLSSLWNETPLIFIAVALVFILLAFLGWKNRRNLRINAGLWAIAIGLTVQVLVSLLMILKHPGNNYLLALAAVFPLLFSAAYTLLGGIPTKLRVIGIGLASLFLLGFVFSLTRSVADHNEHLANIHIVEDEISLLRDEQSEVLNKEPADIKVLWSYATGSKCFALRFGNIYTRGVFSDAINQLCPNDGLHDVFTDEHDFIRIQEWDILIVPEVKIPQEIESIGEIKASNAQSVYGRIHYILLQKETP
jgi:hypothetical protein